MVRLAPRPSSLLPLTDADLLILRSSPQGTSLLATTPSTSLRTLHLFPPARPPHPSTGDSMVNTTLHTSATIPSWHSYYAPATPDYPFGLFTFHLTLGSGLNGHPHKLHGGALGLVIDEVAGRASRLHCSEGKVAFTATMTVDYKKPVDTPGVIVCKSWLEGRSEGRKHWVRAVVEQEGKVVAEGRCLFLEVPRPPEYAKFML